MLFSVIFHYVFEVHMVAFHFIYLSGTQQHVHVGYNKKNDATVNMDTCLHMSWIYFLWLYIQQGDCLVMWLLLFFMFLRKQHSVSTAVVQAYILTNSVWRFSFFFHCFAHCYSCYDNFIVALTFFSDVTLY